jgi:hypothetical protein
MWTPPPTMRKKNTRLLVLQQSIANLTKLIKLFRIRSADVNKMRPMATGRYHWNAGSAQVGQWPHFRDNQVTDQFCSFLLTGLPSKASSAALFPPPPPQTVSFFFLSRGKKLSPLGTVATAWPIVSAPDKRWWLWSNRWDANWHGQWKYSKKTCLSATLSTTNPTLLDPGWNPGNRRGKPATNHLSYGTALSNSYNIYTNIHLESRVYMKSACSYRVTSIWGLLLRIYGL